MGRRLVSKADLQLRSRHTSPGRVIEAGVGSGLLAGGVARTGAVQRTLARGSRAPIRHVNTFRQLERARGATVRATAAGEVLIHRIPGIGGLVELIPGRLRPWVAAGSGASLLSRATPLRRDTYTPYRGV